MDSLIGQSQGVVRMPPMRCFFLLSPPRPEKTELGILYEYCSSRPKPLHWAAAR